MVDLPEWRTSCRCDDCRGSTRALSAAEAGGGTREVSGRGCDQVRILDIQLPNPNATRTGPNREQRGDRAAPGVGSWRLEYRVRPSVRARAIAPIDNLAVEDGQHGVRRGEVRRACLGTEDVAATGSRCRRACPRSSCLSAVRRTTPRRSRPCTRSTAAFSESFCDGYQPPSGSPSGDVRLTAVWMPRQRIHRDHRPVAAERQRAAAGGDTAVGPSARRAILAEVPAPDVDLRWGWGCRGRAAWTRSRPSAPNREYRRHPRFRCARSGAAVRAAGMGFDRAAWRRRRALRGWRDRRSRAS